MKHKHFTFLLAVLMSMVSSVASTHDFEKNGIYYNITSSSSPYTVAVTYQGSSYDSYENEYSGNVVIPESVTYNNRTYSVTSIGDYAFYNCSGLTSVTIPNSVASIGWGAFDGCSGLTKAEFANIESLCGISFSGGYANPLYYAHHLFIDGTEVTDLVIPNSVTSIGESAFRGCSGLTSVTIPNSVTSIGEDAFSNCSGLTKAEFASIESFCGISFSSASANPLCYARHLFIDGTEVTDLVIPNSVTSIGKYAFYNCSGLTSIDIPNSVTSIGNAAFYKCSGLTSIDIPNSVTSIGESAFRGCSGLTSVTIPNSVTNIGNYAFYSCSGLTSVSIGNSVTSIGNEAFSYCSGLTKAEFASIESLCGISFFNASANPLCYARHLFIDGTEVTDLVIPNSVTSIGKYAFYNCSGLTSVSIPESVTSIGGEAFRACSGLTSVIIPNSVTSIGERAFYNCSGLTSITILNSVTDIGNGAFSGTAWYKNQPNGLVYADNIVYTYKGTMPEGTSLVLEEGTVSIGRSAFSGCSGLTSVTIPNSVTSIGNAAFYKCSGLTSIDIPNSVTSIGNDAFSYCSGLTKAEFASIESLCGISFSSASANPLYYAHHLFIDGTEVTDLVIPNSVTSIGDFAFYWCSALTSIDIPNSVTSIGNYAFSNCSGLTSVIIGNSVTNIGSYAFSNCSGLTGSLTIPNSVTSIGNYAFYNCSGLTSVSIPESVTSIGGSAFDGCSGLTKAEFASIESLCGISFSRGYANPLYYAHHLFIDGTEVTDLVIPNSVTSIGDFAFYNCSGLTSVTIPNNVTTIGEAAFNGCTGLKTLVFEDGDSQLSLGYNSSSSGTGKGLFYDCPLETLYFGRNLSYDTDKRYGYSPFYNKTTFTSVTIGNSVTSIGDYAFYNCSGLTGSLTIPNSVTSIGNYAFYNCRGLTGSLTIPNSVTSIGNYAFYNCYGLTGSLTIPNSVTSIGNHAFAGCSGLTGSLTIPNSVTSIGNHAFDGCSGLTSVTIPNSVTSIGNHAFYNCYGLTGSLTIPNSVTSIGINAFYCCHGLTSVTIPNSVTSIGNYAFYWCSGLTSVTIPNSVTSIGNYAFYNCYGLTGSLTIPNSVTSIGNFAFYNCSNLTRINCRATTPPTCGSDCMSYIPEDCTIEVPIGCKAAYEAESPWNNFTIIETEDPVETITLTLAAEYSTFCSTKALDFTGVEGLRAYIASAYDTERGVLTLTRVYNVKARTGLILRGTKGETYEIPEGTGATTVANMLVGVVVDTELNPTEGRFTNFILAKDDIEGIGFYKVAHTSTLKAGKAYLQLPTDDLGSEVKGFRMMFDEDMSDGVETVQIQNSNIKNQNEAGAVYDLQGRRVAKPTKGIYIVNGKKTVIK